MAQGKPELKQVICEKCKKGMPLYIDLIQGTVSKDCDKCGHRNIITVQSSVKPVLNKIG